MASTLNATRDTQPQTSPLDALTAALVESNDLLLGLIQLTEPAGAALDEYAIVDEIATRAVAILDLDELRLAVPPPSADGESVAHRWTGGSSLKTSVLAEADWSAEHSLPDLGSIELSVVRSEPAIATGDVKVLTAVLNLVANGVHMARLHHETVAQALMAREHETAARLTSAALQDAADLPDDLPIDIHASCRPARTTGGDLWAWHLTSSGRLWFAIGDVSGKGLPAAVMMTATVNALRGSFARLGDESPDVVLAAVDREVYPAMSAAGMFVTLLIGCHDDDGFAIANAGQSPAMIVVDDVVERIDASAPPVGVIPDFPCEVWRHPAPAGATVVLATDGFSEQRDAAGDMFGEDAFDEAVVAATAQESSLAMADRLVDLLDDHTGDMDPDDDRTLVVLRRRDV